MSDASRGGVGDGPGGTPAGETPAASGARPDRDSAVEAAGHAVAGGGRGSRAGEVAFASILLLLGLFSAYYPTLLSGFRQLQQDLGDPRLVNYVLEHGFRWVVGWPTHESLWSPPFYHPAPHVGALHDTLLGLGPLYWPWRWGGLPPDTAYQAFMLVVSVVNFAVAYVFLRTGVRTSGTASAGGAFLFAFANPRMARVLHQQLVAAYLPVLAVLCLVLLFRSERARARQGWVLAFFVCWVAQMWSGFYWAWYLVFALCVAGAWALAGAEPRRALVGAIRDAGWVTPLALAGAAALTAPMILEHLAAAAMVGFHDFADDVLPRTARLASWVYMGTPNLVYGLLQDGEVFQSIPIPVEQQLGMGVVTIAAILWGLWTHRSRPLVRALVVVGLVLVGVSTVLPGGFTLWRWVHAWVPGAGAIRAPARSGVVLLLPAAVGLGLALTRLERRGRHLLAAGLLAVCVVEQVRYQPSFDKLRSRAQVAAVAGRVPGACGAFYVVNRVEPDADVAFNPWKYHLDAMWAQLAVDIPTVNGYSGFQPAGWRPVYDNVVRTPSDRARLRGALAEWLGDEADSACIVEVTLP